MKQIPYAAAFLLLAAACRPCHDDVVCETYVHRYGVPLPPEEWCERGQDGQVVSTRKDGVIVTKNYHQGVLDGEATYTFPHRDVIQKRELYQQEVLTQEIFNYPNGIPQRQIALSSPKNYSVTIWYENGVPQCTEEYENDLLVRGEYFTPSYQRESVVDDHQGIRTRRDGYGQMLSIDEIQNGQMVLRTTYHPSGTPQSITPYVNGVAEGQRCTFLPDGQPHTLETWKNDKQEGETIIFENGEKISVMPYVNGKKHGIEKRYRNGEIPVEEVSWVQDQRHGPCYFYVGDNKKIDWYFQGKPVNKATFEVLSRQ